VPCDITHIECVNKQGNEAHLHLLASTESTRPGVTGHPRTTLLMRTINASSLDTIHTYATFLGLVPGDASWRTHVAWPGSRCGSRSCRIAVIGAARWNDGGGFGGIFGGVFGGCSSRRATALGAVGVQAIKASELKHRTVGANALRVHRRTEALIRVHTTGLDRARVLAASREVVAVARRGVGSIRRSPDGGSVRSEAGAVSSDADISTIPELLRCRARKPAGA